ncbi:MAG TPA: hypothetical protein PK941_09720 [Paludibacter sp.]|nr:hypothetical protein [Paludibacter sp.]
MKHYTVALIILPTLAKIIKRRRQQMNLFCIMRILILNIVIVESSILTPIAIHAQLFETNELYQNTSIVNGNYYNGSGGGGYWSSEHVDSIGRIIRRENYHKKQLLSRREFVYDDNNNKIYDIQTFDYNNPERVDTLRYEYKYENNRIVYQFCKLSENDSTVIKLTENQGDTLLKYQEQTFYFRPQMNKTDVYETVYTLKYRNGLLINKEIFDKEQNTTEIRKNEYDENGRFKRRRIERIPKPEQEPYYSGSPGSNDESYEYKLDSQGRIKVFYKIINGKRNKIAVYSYK